MWSLADRDARSEQMGMTPPSALTIAKLCGHCGATKPLADFRRNGKGWQSWCRNCHRDNDAKRAKTPKRLRWSQKYERGLKRRVADKRRRQRTSVKVNARNHLYRALRAGHVYRRPCEMCGSTNSVAHHDDYEKPLDVRWLCRRCHEREHPRVA